jgi:hypothetical protein
MMGDKDGDYMDMWDMDIEDWSNGWWAGDCLSEDSMSSTFGGLIFDCGSGCAAEFAVLRSMDTNDGNDDDVVDSYGDTDYDSYGNYGYDGDDGAYDDYYDYDYYGSRQEVK